MSPALAWRAAWRASADLNSVRADWKWRMPSGAASIARAALENSPRMCAVFGRVTRARSPLLSATRPLRSSASKASADGGPADLEVIHQRALGRKCTALRERAFADQLFERARHFLDIPCGAGSVLIALSTPFMV